MKATDETQTPFKHADLDMKTLLADQRFLIQTDDGDGLHAFDVTDELNAKLQEMFPDEDLVYYHTVLV
eukprot:SAG25_NODE_59_length_18387_cov_33.379770_4_plen_68_part_00